MGCDFSFDAITDGRGKDIAVIARKDFHVAAVIRCLQEITQEFDGRVEIESVPGADQHVNLAGQFGPERGPILFDLIAQIVTLPRLSHFMIDSAIEFMDQAPGRPSSARGLKTASKESS